MMLRRPPDISVIIPTCRPKQLVKCLHQLNAQVLPPQLEIETIVVAETDISRLQLPRECVTARKRRSGNCGAAARDLGISMARGRYLCFWDDDNRYREFALLTQYTTASGHDIGVVQIDHWDGAKYHRLPRRLPGKVTLGDIDTMCLCVRREVAVTEKWDEHKGIGTDFYWLEKILRHDVSLNFVPIVIGEHL